MTDREKVIRGWERCRKCHDAPMLFSESYRDCEYTRGMYCRQDILIEDTLALLKEQEDLGTELTNAVELIHKKNERIEKLLKEHKELRSMVEFWKEKALHT